jgi:hypothetical protein
MRHSLLRELICRLRGHKPKPDGDGYHYCGRCGDTVLYGEVDA